MNQVSDASKTKDSAALVSDRNWFFAGARAALSLPGLLLMIAMLGFTALAKEAGLTLVQTLFMTLVIWALPAQVVLVGAISSGVSLPAAAIAVTLTSVRLMPMAVALMPEMRVITTRRWVLYALSHFVAVTSWVIAMERFRDVPRTARTAYYAGIASMLVSGGLLVIIIAYLAVARLPAPVAAAMLFLMPMYFLFSLWGSARERAGQVAMALGLLLGPVFHVYLPGFDLLATGLIAGTLAFGFHLIQRRHSGEVAATDDV